MYIYAYTYRTRANFGEEMHKQELTRLTGNEKLLPNFTCIFRLNLHYVQKVVHMY